MAMEIRNDTFYMVQLPENKTIHQSEENAIEHLENRAGGINPESEEVSVVQISVNEGDWTIAEMSWQNIALRLMGE